MTKDPSPSDFPELPLANQVARLIENGKEQKALELLEQNNYPDASRQVRDFAGFIRRYGRKKKK